MKTCVCRYVRISRLGCGVKWGSFRGTRVGRRLHFQKHVCCHHWYSARSAHQGQGYCFRRWSWCILIDIVYVAYIFLCTKKYPILLFLFDKRVRTGATKNENLQCIENQGFEKNLVQQMFLQTTGWVRLGSEIRLWAACVPALKEDRPGLLTRPMFDWLSVEEFFAIKYEVHGILLYDHLIVMS